MSHFKNFNMKVVGVSGAATALSVLIVGTAFATSSVVVTPANTQGWSTADTRPGGSVTFVLDATAPLGTGALQLTTDATTAAKAQYMHAATVPLVEVTDASYYTKQIVSTFSQGDPSYQMVTYLNGGTSGFTTLVFEPYQNPMQGPVAPNVWQKWDVLNGQFWSTRVVTCSGGTITVRPTTYTLEQVKALCPDALVVGFGVNIGSNNPGYTIRTDLVAFNGVIYDFELTNVPTNKNQCKHDGYVNFTDSNGQSFKNQGQCVKYVEKRENQQDNNSENEIE